MDASLEKYMDMQLNTPKSREASQFELRFQSLFHTGKALAFPCNAHGVVQLDALSAKALENYLFARAVVGREYAAPLVQACDAA